jgi:hypothetical protein
MKPSVTKRDNTETLLNARWVYIPQGNSGFQIRPAESPSR